jgi:diguanylate cyclase (GGDEF)-like protein/PAS domain S-box-containing protein
MQDIALKSRGNAFAGWTAGAAALIGASALIAWWLGAHAWLQAGGTQVPIQFNSALGILLVAASLLSLQRSRRALAVILVLPVLALALPSLIQEMSGIDLGVDRILFHPDLTAEGVPPGRMAPNAAFCLLLAGIAVLVLALGRGRDRSRLFASLSGAVILVLVLVVLFGYAFDVPLARAWGERTPMALLAAIGLSLLGLSLVVSGWSAWSLLSVRSRTLALAVGALALAMAVIGWLGLDARLSDGLQLRMDAHADRTAAAIESQVVRQLSVVPYLARRLRALGRPPNGEDFLREAELHIEIFEVSHILAWVDVDGTIRIIVGRDLQPETFAHVLDTSMLLDEARRASFARAMETRRPVLSASTRLVATGEQGLLLLAPVESGGEVTGMVGAAIDVRRPFSELAAIIEPGIDVDVFDGDDVLWRSHGVDAAGAFMVSRSVDLFERVWRVEVAPQAATMREARGNLPELLLMIGLAAAGLLTLALAFAGLARERMRLAEASRTALEQAEHRAGRMLDSISEGFLALDRDWRYVRVNAQALALLSMRAEELLGRRIWDVFSELVGSETQTRFEAAVKSGVAVSYEMYHERQKVWYEVRAFPSEEGLAVYFRDITQRRLERAMLERSEKQLRQAQAVAGLGSWEMDVATGSIAVSGQFYALHGIREQTFDGSWTAFLAMLPAEIAEHMVRAQSCAMSGERCELTYGLVMDGRRRTLYLNAEGIVEPGEAGPVVSATVQDVTVQEEARLRLAESEARHRGIVETSLDAIITMGADGNISEFNPAAERIFGWTREQAVGRELADLIVPERLRERHRRGLRTYLDSGSSNILGRQLQMSALHADGSEFSVELGISRIEGSDPPVFTGFVRDTTERLRAERELNRQARIIDQINDAVSEVDLDGIVLSWNKGAERLLGYSAEEMIGQSIDRIYPPDWQARRHSVIEEPLLTYGEHYVEVEQQRKDGKRIWVQLSLSLLRDEQGRPVGSLGYAFDISRRRHVEEELRLQQRAIEASANGIVIVDAADSELPILFVNPAFEDITGYAMHEALGRNCRFLQGEDRDQPALEELRRAIAEERGCRVLLRNYRKDGSMFWNDLHLAPVLGEDGRVTHFVGVQNDVTESRQHELLLEHRALHDELTGLPNRARILELLTKAMAAAEADDAQVRVVLVNLDRLHQVNDTLGYEIGDRVILEAAERLVHVAATVGARVARVGGDEFLLLMPPRLPHELEDGLAGRAIAELSRPYEVMHQRVFLTASAGVSTYPEAAGTPVTLLAHADIAVKRAKQAGRNQVAVFTNVMAAQLADRVAVGAALRGALAADEMEMHLQPLVHARDGTILAGEALMRWTSAKLGFVSPARFIPVAEDSGMIVVLGEWALRTALGHAAAWRPPRGGPLVSVSVNVSSVQFQRPEFVHEVEEALRERGLPATALMLEITESVVMEDAQQAIALLTLLRRLGIRISLDDFGTGHSSLGYLRHLPVDEVKIDRVFVQDVVNDPYATSLCRAIISMAKALDMNVVAEGVETETQARFLSEAGCDQLQGYLFSKPVQADAFARLLKEGARWSLDGARVRKRR